MTNLAEEFGWSLRARGDSHWTIHDHTTAVRRFLEALEMPIEDSCAGRSFNDCRDAAFAAVLASTGCRRSEIERMMLTDVDLDAGTIVLPVTKNGKGRVAYLEPGPVAGSTEVPPVR